MSGDAEARLGNAMMAASVESGKAMGSAMKQDSKEEGVAELYKLNQVWYKMPPTLSLVSKRTITRCNFQQVTYAGTGAPLYQQIASCIFNTGEFHVNGKTSYLVIQAGIDKSRSDLATIFAPATLGTADLISQNKLSTHAYLGQGGIMNILDEVTFLSASGTECDRQQNKGLQASHVQRNRYPQDWYNTAGEIQGVPGGTYQDCYDNKGWPGSMATLTGAVYSPYLMPTRSEGTTDYSNTIINAQSNIGNTGGRFPWSGYDNTRFIGPRYTGSVDVSFDSTYNATYNPTVQQALYFIVPMSEILGMFRPYMDALIPSQVLAGGRLELRFKNMTESLIATGPGFAAPAAAGAGYSTSSTATTNAGTFLNAFQIYNIYFLLDSFQLNEGTLRRLNEAAASNDGLMLMYDTWDWTQTQPAGLAFEAQVSQARSRILRSFCVIRDSMMRTNPFANSLASEAAVNRSNGNRKYYLFAGSSAASQNSFQLLVNNYQAVLGSLYFPQQPLQTAEEYCMNSYYMWCRSTNDLQETNSVTYNDFVGANGYNMYDKTTTPGTTLISAPISRAEGGTLYTDGHPTGPASAPIPSADQRAYSMFSPNYAINWGSSTYGFVAERSQLLQLSGLPISNARLLRHRFVLNYTEYSQTGRIVDAFTEYTRALKVFLGGRVVVRE
jgi:hypothetical protein